MLIQLKIYRLLHEQNFMLIFNCFKECTFSVCRLFCSPVISGFVTCYRCEEPMGLNSLPADCRISLLNQRFVFPGSPASYDSQCLLCWDVSCFTGLLWNLRFPLILCWGGWSVSCTLIGCLRLFVSVSLTVTQHTGLLPRRPQ